MDHLCKNRLMHLSYSYSASTGSMGKSAFIYLSPFSELFPHPLLLLLSQPMRLQLEILPHLAAWWGEDKSLLVAAGAAAFRSREEDATH